jgi:membrane-associated HD superfamily phosphohydrolase
MKKTLKLYSFQEIEEMKEAITSTSTSIKKLSKDFSKKFERTERATEQKLLKLSKYLSRPNNVKRHIPIVEAKEKKTNSFFYSKDEIDEMTHLISTTSTPIMTLAKTLANKYNRSVNTITTKMNNLCKNIDRPVVEEKKQAIAKINVQKALVPNSIGIDVPEGTSFDIKKVKRVVLQKDCFTIYF